MGCIRRILPVLISLRRSKRIWLSQTQEVEKTFAIYDQSSKRMASGTYETVDENGISLRVDGKPYAALLYSNEKFYYVDENHEVTCGEQTDGFGDR